MIPSIKNTAARLLQKSDGTYQRLVRIHSSITVGVWLLLFILSYLIHFLAPEGGLSNLGMHSMIFTTQVILFLVGLFLVPFWETGLSCVAIDFIRGKRNISSDLTEGFRCAKPILGSMVFQGIQYFLVYLISSSATGVVLTLLPLSQTFYQDATVLLQNPDTPLKGRMLIVAVVYSVVFISLLLVLASFIFFRYRMARRVILDDESITGIKAAFQSRTLMKGKLKKLLTLDLSFWWFYIPEFLGILLPASVILISGLDVPLSDNVQTILWATAGGSLLLRLTVNYFAKPKVAANYALFYDRLLTQDDPIVEDGPQKAPPKKPPKRVPWQY